MAEVIKHRHDTLDAFLVAIGVSRSVADRDACIIELELSDEIVEQIRRYVAFLRTPVPQRLLATEFLRFCATEP